MIHLMPYSIYEVEAMDAFLSQMAKRGWQYHWRFLCFMGFRKKSDARAPKCVLRTSGKTSIFPRIYRSNELGADVVLRPSDTDSVQAEVPYLQLKETTIAKIIEASLLIVAFGIFFVLCCVSHNWDSVNALWGMREVASLLLPCAICLAVDLVFLAVRLVKIQRFRKQKEPYLPRKSYVRYGCILLAVVSLVVQFAVWGNMRMSAEQTAQYEAYASTLFKDANNTDSSVIVSHFILEPESWENLSHVGGGDVRIAYHECLTSVGAKNYLAQFQRDNYGTVQTFSAEQGVQICYASDKDYYAIACVCKTQVLIISARYLGADTDTLLVNELAEIFLDG